MKIFRLISSLPALALLITAANSSAMSPENIVTDHWKREMSCTGIGSNGASKYSLEIHQAFDESGTNRSLQLYKNYVDGGVPVADSQEGCKLNGSTLHCEIERVTLEIDLSKAPIITEDSANTAYQHASYSAKMTVPYGPTLNITRKTFKSECHLIIPAAVK